jgi:hypothetical protein
MVEVFKTNVSDIDQAKFITSRIKKTFVTYHINFDLDDCDKILRVESQDGIQSTSLIELLRDFGIQAEVLPDIIEEPMCIEDILHE